MNQDRREKLRLENYDYSSNGAYFVTVCTHQKVELFGCVGQLSEAADTIGEVFEDVLSNYSCIIDCPKYVVMPNHFHALIVFDRMDDVPARSLAEFMKDCSRKF